MQGAIHTRSFRLIYGSPKRSDIDGKWTKGALSLLVQLVSIGHLGNATYKNLAAKIKSRFIRMVNFFVNSELMKNALFPGYIRNSVTNRICSPDRFQEEISLFSLYKNTE